MGNREAWILKFFQNQILRRTFDCQDIKRSTPSGGGLGITPGRGWNCLAPWGGKDELSPVVLIRTEDGLAQPGAHASPDTSRTGGFSRHPVQWCPRNSHVTRNGCPSTACVSDAEIGWKSVWRFSLWWCPRHRIARFSVVPWRWDGRGQSGYSIQPPHIWDVHKRPECIGWPPHWLARWGCGSGIWLFAMFEVRIWDW